MNYRHMNTISGFVILFNVVFTYYCGRQIDFELMLLKKAGLIEHMSKNFLFVDVFLQYSWIIPTIAGFEMFRRKLFTLHAVLMHCMITMYLFMFFILYILQISNIFIIYQMH